MSKLKLALGTGLLVVCLTGTTFANDTVYALFNNIQNIVWLTLTGDFGGGENPTNTTNRIILPVECPVRDCGNCRPDNPTCRPPE